MESKLELYNDDCLNILKQIPNTSIDLIVTDPPYKTTSRGSCGNAGGMLKKDIFNKGNVFEHNSIGIKDYMSELYRVLCYRSHCYIMTNHVNLHSTLNTAIDCGFKFIKSLIWNKGNKIMGPAYMSQFEYILFFRKGEFKKINNCGASDIIVVPNKKLKDFNGDNLHDTEKPVELMKILINNSTSKGDIVLDPFMGIGSTGVACRELERKFVGIEIDKKYFDIAKQRIENFKKQMKIF